jgi:DNA primase
MPIPDETVEEVRAAADIVDVAGDYVQLKRSGSRYKGLCPFHNEKTPSFSVDPDQNLYYCFGCSSGGDVFKFIQEIEGVGFLESVRILAERYGIPIPEDEADTEAANERESILHALRFAGRFFYRQLTQTQHGKKALDYLKGRGFTPKTITKFGLGYAPDSWDALLTAAEDEQIPPETLEKAGLIIERNDGSGYYDRYRNRVIFPLFSHIGKVLGFAGRILNGDSDQPKYINSPETKVYHKKEVLYGLYQAKRAIRKEEEVLLVEGYTDVISLFQAGIQNVVASSGTALTAEQLQTLDRYAKRVVMLYDADEAGGRAAERGMDLALEEGLGAYAVELPAGEDPDSYVQAQGGEAFAEHVATARQDLPTFRYRRARRQGQLDTPEDRVEVQRDIMDSIAKIPDPNLRREYVVRTSDVVDVPDSDLFRMLEEAREAHQQKSERRERRQKKRQEIRQRQQEAVSAEAGASGPPEHPPREAPAPEVDEPDEPLPEEKVLFRLMLEEGSPMVAFILGNMALDEFTEGTPRELVNTFVAMYTNDAVQPAKVLNGECGDDLQSLAASVMMNEFEPSKNWARHKDIRVPRLNQEPREAAASAMTLLKLDRVNDAIDQQRERIYQADRNGNDEALRRLQQQMMSLHELRKRIKNREFLE